jgi:hypothetical protein
MYSPDSKSLSFPCRGAGSFLALFISLAWLFGCEKQKDVAPTEAAQPISPTVVRVAMDKESVPAESQRVNPEMSPKSEAGLASFQRRVEFVRKLGRDKRVDAIPMLLDELFKITPLTTDNALDFGETFPCSAALIDIGEAAVPQVQSRFLKSNAHVGQNLLLHILIQIEGPAAVAKWLDDLPVDANPTLTKERRVDLQQWALSQSR